MRVTAADGHKWGNIQTAREEQTVMFSAEGELRDTVWRIWGISEGKQPLLIGVPEPQGERMILKRSLSQCYLERCGYWPNLPERYVIGESPEIAFADFSRKKEDGSPELWERTYEGYRILQCFFVANRPFPLAYVFSFCRIHGQIAEVWIDTKTGRPVWDHPDDKT